MSPRTPAAPAKDKPAPKGGLPAPRGRPAAEDLVQLSPLQKAAVLCMYLDEETVRLIFGELEEDEIRRVGAAIAHLPEIRPETIQQVVFEFCNELAAETWLPSQGRDYLMRVFPRVIGEERAQDIVRGIDGMNLNRFRQRLTSLSPQALAAIVRREHPQTIAVICALVGPQAAARILDHLDEEMRTEVFFRMASLRKIPVEVLSEIEDALSERFPAKASPMPQLEGTQLAADALKRMEKEAKEGILASLGQYSADLAGEITKSMFGFSALAAADDRGVQALLKEVQRKDLTLALKAAEDEVKDKFFKNMSDRAAQFLRDDLAVMGPARLKDVEESQQAIVAIALRLEEEGKLVFLGASDGVVM